MNSAADSHARHVLSVYAKSIAGSTGDWDVLLRIIAEQVHKAVSEDRETLRENLPCDAREPCAFDNVCAHHKALADAILASQPGAQ